MLPTARSVEQAACEEKLQESGSGSAFRKMELPRFLEFVSTGSRRSDTDAGYENWRPSSPEAISSLRRWRRPKTSNLRRSLLLSPNVPRLLASLFTTDAETAIRQVHWVSHIDASGLIWEKVTSVGATETR